jgi:hypothetical protein
MRAAERLVRNLWRVLTTIPKEYRDSAPGESDPYIALRRRDSPEDSPEVAEVGIVIGKGGWLVFNVPR